MGAQQAKESRSSGKDKHSHRAKPVTATTPTTTKVEPVRLGHSVNIFTEHSGKISFFSNLCSQAHEQKTGQINMIMITMDNVIHFI